MNTSLTTVAEFLESVPYYPCLLLVHPEIKRLQKAADELRESYAWPQVSIRRELSEMLLLVEPEHRSRKAARWLEKRLRESRPGPVLCTDIDLLFEPSLQLDPLALFRSASRITRLVVIWSGDYRNGVLAYAVPEHSHYRTWSDPQVTVSVLT